MHIRKYDFDYSRRHFLDKTAKGIGSAGVLMSLWPMLSKADSPDISKAYPDELLSIEIQSKGKIKPGDTVTADNVEHVSHLLDPITLEQVRNHGRQLEIVDSTRDISKLFDAPYLEATLKNQGKATLDSDGNIWHGSSGTPWRGGLAYVEPENGLQATYNLTLAWGRHNNVQYAIPEIDLGPDGDIQYNYNWVWIEMNVTSRTDGTIFQDRSDLLRFNTAFFTAPNEQAGTAFLNTWYYDQRKFPELAGYLPAFKRVRQYPTRQRFEPLIPGGAFYFSDSWGAGDPTLTWGNYKILERKPMLGPVGPGHNWYPDQEQWKPPFHGGGKGQSFRATQFELVPEVVLVESEPVAFSRAPYGKKIVGLDARHFMSVFYNTYDRKGELFKSHELGTGLYDKGDNKNVITRDYGPVWGWKYSIIHNIQTNRITNLWSADKVAGGYTYGWDETDEENLYNKYLTEPSLRRLGS